MSSVFCFFFTFFYFYYRHLLVYSVLCHKALAAVFCDEMRSEFFLGPDEQYEIWVSLHLCYLFFKIKFVLSCAPHTNLMGQSGVENEHWGMPFQHMRFFIYLKTCPPHKCMDSKIFESWEFPLSSETSTGKRGNVKERSFNGAGERAVRGTVVAQQMKIDTDN